MKEQDGSFLHFSGFRVQEGMKRIKVSFVRASASGMPQDMETTLLAEIVYLEVHGT